MRSRKISSLFFAVAAGGINPPNASGDFEKMLERFQYFASTFKEENSHFTEVTAKKVEGFRDDVISESDLTPILVMEYKIRGLLPEPITFKDLSNVVQNGRLLDEGLWSMIHAPDFGLFGTGPTAQKNLEGLRSFLLNHQTGELFSQKRGYWWRYLVEGNFKGIELIEDADFQAWIEFQYYAKTSFPERISIYLSVRSKIIPNDIWRDSVSDLDRAFREQLLSAYSVKQYPKMFNDIERAVSDRVTEVNLVRVQEQKLNLYLMLTDAFKKKGQAYWVAESEMRWLELARRLAQNQEAKQIFEIIDGTLRAERYRDSFSLLSLVDQKKLTARERGEFQFLRARTYEGYSAQVSDLEIQKNYLEWAAEYYRRSLNQLLMTEHRDDLLKSYARVLGLLELPEARMAVLQTLFRGGSVRENQIEGLLSFVSESLTKAEDESDPSVKLKSLGKALSLLAQFARANPEKPEIPVLFARAQKIVEVLGENSTPQVKASLFEVQNVLENLKKKNRSASARVVRKNKNKSRQP